MQKPDYDANAPHAHLKETHQRNERDAAAEAAQEEDVRIDGMARETAEASSHLLGVPGHIRGLYLAVQKEPTDDGLWSILIDALQDGMEGGLPLSALPTLPTLSVRGAEQLRILERIQELHLSCTPALQTEVFAGTVVSIARMRGAPQEFLEELQRRLVAWEADGRPERSANIPEVVNGRLMTRIEIPQGMERAQTAALIRFGLRCERWLGARPFFDGQPDPAALADALGLPQVTNVQCRRENYDTLSPRVRPLGFGLGASRIVFPAGAKQVAETESVAAADILRDWPCGIFVQDSFVNLPELPQYLPALRRSATGMALPSSLQAERMQEIFAAPWPRPTLLEPLSASPLDTVLQTPALAPALSRLHLGPYDAASSLIALASSAVLDQLDELHFQETRGVTGDAIRALIASGRLKNLRFLAFVSPHAGPGVLEALAEAPAGAFPALQHLDIGGPVLDPQLRARLESRYPSLSMDTFR